MSVKRKNRDTFEFELEKCGFTESDIRIIKSIISKYAPKEREINPSNHSCDLQFCSECGKEGENSYRAELFREFKLKEV